MRESVPAKGRRYVSEGRLLIESVTSSEIRATCRGGGMFYRLGFDNHGWYCNCPARGHCAHLHALQLVVIAPTEPKDRRTSKAIGELGNGQPEINDEEHANV